MACQPVGGLHLPLSDSDRIQDRPIGTINQHRALKFHLTATSLSSLDIYAPKLINPTNCCIRCFLVPHHVDEMPQWPNIGPVQTSGSHLPTRPGGKPPCLLRRSRLERDFYQPINSTIRHLQAQVPPKKPQK